MLLSTIRDWIDTLSLAGHVYMGKLLEKQEQSIGVYNSKHEYPYATAIGGEACASYGEKHVTFLVHWNKSPRDTEAAAQALFTQLTAAESVQTNEGTIQFITPLTSDPIDVGTDDAGIYEMVIEAAVIYQKNRKDDE